MKKSCNKTGCPLTYDLLMLLFPFYLTFYLHSAEISLAAPNGFDLRSALGKVVQKQIICVSKPA